MRHVLVELSFKVHRGLVAEGAVEPRPVVKDFDPFEDRRARLGARGENLPRCIKSRLSVLQKLSMSALS